MYRGDRWGHSGIRALKAPLDFLASVTNSANRQVSAEPAASCCSCAALSVAARGRWMSRYMGVGRSQPLNPFAIALGRPGVHCLAGWLARPTRMKLKWYYFQPKAQTPDSRLQSRRGDTTVEQGRAGRGKPLAAHMGRSVQYMTCMSLRAARGTFSACRPVPQLPQRAMPSQRYPNGRDM